MLILEILFWVSIGLILHTYFIYPLILFVASSIIQATRDMKYLLSRTDRRRDLSQGDLPFVSLLIAAYNEEKVIDEKILNSLALDYPKDRLEIIVGSDGSSDKTNSIVKGHLESGVKLLDFSQRRGKTSVLNDMAERARGEILVFSDANTIYSRDSITKLVGHFHDTDVGGVCGELRLRTREGTPVEEGIYWKYEVMLKFMESRLGSVLGANGGIYAIRKNLFHPIPPDTIVDDFVIGMRVREQGFRVLFDPEATGFEDTAEDTAAEMTRRIRIAAGNFQSIGLTYKLLGPSAGFTAFAFWSHKIIRWFVPFFLISAFVSNIFLLDSVFFLFTLVAQSVFYIMSTVGFGISRKLGKESRILSVMNYFFLMNYAIFLGFFRYLRRTQKVTWKRTER